MTDEEKKALEEQKARELAEETEKTAKSLLEKMGITDALAKIDAFEKAQKDSAIKIFCGKDLQKEVSELSPEEKVKAFAAALHAGDEVAIKALSEGVDADGGYVVPEEFYSSLIQEFAQVAKFRNLVTVVPMNSKTLEINSIINGPDVFWTGEGVTKTTTSAEFGAKVLTAYKLAAIIYMTDELDADARFNLSQVIINRFARKMAEAEDKAIVNGTGSGQPTGLFASGTGVGTVTASGNLDFDDIIDLIYSLPEEYRANATLVTNGVNVKELRKLKDSNGLYLWSPAISPGLPNTVMGYPVVETPWAPESKILFGDLRETYFFGDRQRMTVKITQDETTAFFQDKTAIRVVERVAGNVVAPWASKILQTIP